MTLQDATPEKPKGQRWRKAFLAALRETGNVRLSAEVAKIERSTAYNLRRSCPVFANEWKQAVEDACDLLEAEARRRAYFGVDEPVIHLGRLMGHWVDPNGCVVAPATEGARQIPLTVKKYSDTLMIFLLKGYRPGRFRDNVRVEHSGDQDSPIHVEGSVQHDHTHTVSPTALAAFEADLVAAGLGHLPADGVRKPVDSPPPAPQAATVHPAR